MNSLITPQTLKGFRDALPAQEMRRRDLMASLEASFRAFGFEPIDTPALEYEDILLGKGGGESDKQIYRFTDHGDRRVALRYDLTVPFARFTAQHREELPLPFKRYHMAKVWRGENTQKGRFREFFQCDFDIVGADSADADAEILLLMVRSLELLGAGRVSIRLSHRKLLPLLATRLGVGASVAEVLRVLDKRDKIGPDALKTELGKLLPAVAVGQFLDFTSPLGGWDDAFARVEKFLPEAGEWLVRLREITSRLRAAGVLDRVLPDFGITRGLDYYTGVVYETILDELPGIGSVCSGGRYDNLASLYTKEHLPGVGSSVGLDRLLAGLEELGVLGAGARTADVLVMQPEGASTSVAWETALALRTAGVKTDLFCEQKKPSAQYTYAERKNIPLSVLPRGEGWTLKRLADGEQQQVAKLDDVVRVVTGWLA